MDLENFPTSESAKRMLESVDSGGFYDNSYIGKWIFQVMGLEMDEARQIIEELPYQAFPETATWGLRYHEQKYGLPVRNDLSYEERRHRICQRISVIGPMTPYKMEYYIWTRLGLVSEVSDVHDSGSFNFKPDHPNKFLVVIKQKNENADINYDSVENLVKQIKQSHTAFFLEHRQEFDRQIEIYAGAVATELIEYEIKPKTPERYLEHAICSMTAVLIDSWIMEEIGSGRG